MSSVKSQAIAGVSVGYENVVSVVYPSVAATALGRLVGNICDSIPVKIGGIKLSNLLFGLPLAPVGLLIYLGLKVSGRRYVLTNEGLEARASLGNRLFRETPLTDIAEIAVERQPGQAFYKAADVYLLNDRGDVLMEIPGIVRAEVFRHRILETRDARVRTASALAAIQSRQPA